MNCPECNSKEVIAHTDSKLRINHELLWQCFDCNAFWKTSWYMCDNTVSVIKKIIKAASSNKKDADKIYDIDWLLRKI